MERDWLIFARLEKETKDRYEAGSLEAIAYNLVRTFEMEASFKTNPQQWISAVADKFNRNCGTFL